MKHSPPQPIDPSNECSFGADNEPIMGDCMNGHYTAEERLSLGLLQLLCKISTPKYAYGSIMALFADATQAKATVTTTFCTRATAIKYFATWFQLESLYPTTITKRLLGRSYPCVTHDFTAMMKSMLSLIHISEPTRPY